MSTPTPQSSSELEALYADYDHLEPPLGPDGMPCAYFVEHLRDLALAAKQPVGWSNEHGGFWVVTGYPEVKSIIDDTDGFSSAGVIFPKYAVTEPLMLAEQDAPEHLCAPPGASVVPAQERRVLLRRSVRCLDDPVHA